MDEGQGNDDEFDWIVSNFSVVSWGQSSIIAKNLDYQQSLAASFSK